jgi:hypothetical protein
MPENLDLVRSLYADRGRDEFRGRGLFTFATGR